MSIFGRALAGAGAGAAALAAKYVDEELAANRAKLLSDLQQQSFEKQDAYLNSPTRRETLRGEAAKDEKVKNDAAFEGKVRELTDPTYTQAQDKRFQQQTPMMVEREAALAGAKPYDLSPGQMRFQGDKKLASNDRPTPQEVQDGLYRDEIKRSSPNGIKLPEAVKVQAEGMRDRLKSIERLVDEGIASGDLLDKAPTDPKKADAYERFKRLDRSRRMLSQQFEDLIAPYAGSGAGQGGGGPADPLNLRGSKADAGSNPDTMTDPASGQPVSRREKTASIMEAIQADMEKNGITNARADVAGQRIPINRQQAAPAAPAAAQAGAPAAANTGEPSFFARLMQKAGEMGTDYTSPQGKQMLAQRVAEAKKGGKPLTDIEQLRAKQAGLI